LTVSLPAPVRCPRQQLQRVRCRQVWVSVHSGGKELQKQRPQPQHVPGPLPHCGLMRTGQQLHRVGQIAVPGDWAVMVTVETDDLRQDMRVAGVALGPRGGVPLPVARRRERVDRVHLVSGRPQCPYPRPAISLDPDDNLSCYLLGRQFRPVRRSMLSEQCVQPGDARQALR